MNNLVTTNMLTDKELEYFERKAIEQKCNVVLDAIILEKNKRRKIKGEK